MTIKGKRKVIPDIFGKSFETVHISGLIDALDGQQFEIMPIISNVLDTCVEPTVKEMINADVDWTPKELLPTMISKAISLASDSGQIVAQGNGTYVVPSCSNAREPGIVITYIQTDRSSVMIIAQAMYRKDL